MFYLYIKFKIKYHREFKTRAEQSEGQSATLELGKICQ